MLNRHLNHHRTHVDTGNKIHGVNQKKVKLAHKKKKKRHPIFEPLTFRLHGQRPTCYPSMFVVYIDRDWYLPIRTNRRLDNLTKKTKTDTTRCRETTRARPRPPPGRVERDEQGEARRAPHNGGPHLEQRRLRLKTWSKSDFSIAETTWPTYLYIYLYLEYEIFTPRGPNVLCIYEREWYCFYLVYPSSMKNSPSTGSIAYTVVLN